MESKVWWQSRAVWGGIISAGAGIAGLFGYGLTAGDQAQLADAAVILCSAAGSAVGGAIAVWGRIQASKAIG
ncbi:MAG: hypothetical protein K2Q10_12325 [Rhodospirillales bacterium]|nr:hypothetical protein [Rhodospirillales bacterium]